jgi:hypothetical protein
VHDTMVKVENCIDAGKLRMKPEVSLFTYVQCSSDRSVGSHSRVNATQQPQQPWGGAGAGARMRQACLANQEHALQLPALCSAVRCYSICSSTTSYQEPGSNCASGQRVRC